MVFLFPNNNFAVGKVPVFLKKKRKSFFENIPLLQKMPGSVFYLIIQG